MTTKVKALDRLIDAIAGSDVPVAAQTVAGTIDALADTLAGGDVTFTAQDIAGRINELAGMIEDGTISIGGDISLVNKSVTILTRTSNGQYFNTVRIYLAPPETPEDTPVCEYNQTSNNYYGQSVQVGTYVLVEGRNIGDDITLQSAQLRWSSPSNGSMDYSEHVTQLNSNWLLVDTTPIGLVEYTGKAILELTVS